MLYVGIDQHRKQLTVSVRDESGSVLIRRQVSTEWQNVRTFCHSVLTCLRIRTLPDSSRTLTVNCLRCWSMPTYNITWSSWVHEWPHLGDPHKGYAVQSHHPGRTALFHGIIVFAVAETSPHRTIDF